MFRDEFHMTIKKNKKEHMKRIIAILFFCILLVHCSKTKPKEELAPKDSREKIEVSTISKDSDSTQAIALKGAELGKVYEGEATLFTTVAEVEGVISISLLEDKRIYKIAFMSNKMLSDFEIASFKKSIESNYHIQLAENKIYKKNYYNYSENIYYSYIENRLEKNSYSISFSITDKNLIKLKNLKPSTDF